jgi:S1-C subfamily serine protease
MPKRTANARKRAREDQDDEEDLPGGHEQHREHQQKGYWEDTIAHVIPCVVALEVSSVRAFDSERYQTSQATGFIVDLERGLILTNRHVVGTGPCTASATFYNKESCTLRAVYRDPVHDFGFFKFDPAALDEHTKLRALKLAPQEAQVGTEIRVVGNDAAERISIASGTLARLDRDAPSYGADSFSDFNTFYYQASSGTIGGSSGSPVVNILGHAVALNAAGKEGASQGFYLPLDRVERALRLLQQGMPITRGTMQTCFVHRPMNAVKKTAGLTTKMDAFVRKNDTHANGQGVGMLVVDEVTKGGPADGLLECGDAVLKLGGTLITHFVPLEELLDESIGKDVELTLVRGGKEIKRTVRVGDLDAILPSQMLEISGGILNELSYHQARNYVVEVGGAFVAYPGYMFRRLPQGSVIAAVQGVRTPTLLSLVEAMEKIPDAAFFPIRVKHLSNFSREYVVSVQMDRRWFPMQLRTRGADDVWTTTQCKDAPPAVVEKAVPRLLPPAAKITSASSSQDILAKSLVTVDFDCPFGIE